ncbi:hypothetical protein CDD80_6911 [Ophiocordyceps camponoti-rufipedis]|uniref:Uncharacterized protein n=1 Tax=Ophiocordyceps camponoti-rufipedis TaxID=2004952 RepID=A0A2C5ZNF3_9HYPO|nr:hypothetical protein CDD80_6911 [Ophiocordyceps camponoti-rufipedis]
MMKTTVIALALVSGVLGAPLRADSQVAQEGVARLNQTYPEQPRPSSRVASMRQGGMNDNLLPLGVKPPFFSHVQHDNRRGFRNGWRGYKHDKQHGHAPPEYYGGMDRPVPVSSPVATPVAAPVPTSAVTSAVSPTATSAATSAPTSTPTAETTSLTQNTTASTAPNSNLRAATGYQSKQAQSDSVRFPPLSVRQKAALIPLLLPSNLTTAPAPAASTTTTTATKAAATPPKKFSFLDLFKPKTKFGEDLAAVSKQPKTKKKNFLADFFKRMKEYFTKILERGKEIFAKYIGAKGEKGIKQGTTSSVGDYSTEPATAEEKGDPSPLGR